MKRIDGFPKSKQFLVGFFIIGMLAFSLTLAKTLLTRDAVAQVKKGDSQALTRYTFANLVEKLRPSVVNIYTTQVIKAGRFLQYPDDYSDNDQGDDKGRGFQGKRRDNPFYHFFGDDFFQKFFRNDVPQGDIKEQSLGSGFIISDDGYIVTNNHVVERATEIKVKLANEDEYEARVVGKDKKTDLALIKITPKKNLTPVKMGNSSDLKVGEWVVAIGNPFGLSNSLTAGIVSAMGRSLHTGPYDDFIQTDASINPGNSGGPLLNLDGEAVGVNTAIVAPPAQGIGFAIPIDLAKNVVNQLKTKGKVVRGWLGVSIQEITPELKKSFNLKTGEGALVSEIFRGSPADEAKIQKGDVVVTFDGKKISKFGDLSRIVADTPVGKTVDAEVIRDNLRISVKVKVSEMKDTEGGKVVQASTENKLGVSVQDLNPELRKSLALKSDESGVLVSEVDPQSQAYENGVRNGDVIKQFLLNGEKKQINSVKDFEAISLKVKKDDVVAFNIKRKEGTAYTAFTVK